MIKEIIATGKDVSEAKENARVALGADILDDVKFEVLHAGSKGIFGLIGVKPAQVKAYIELPDRSEKKNRQENKQRSEQKTEESPKNGERRNKQRSDRNRKSGANDRPRVEKTKPEERKVEKSEKPKVAAVPETQLKFEKMDVKDGEDMSFEFVKTLLGNLELNATAELYACEDGTRRINIVGDDASALIGHHGDTMDALQYLTNLASARKNINGERNKSRVSIDIEGYRAKREETLRALARRMAQKALRNKRSVMLEPMTAYERRIIHSEIQSIEGVSTNSIGSDNNRKIVIYLTDKKPKGVFAEDNAKTSILEEFATEQDEAIGTINDTVAVSTQVCEATDIAVAAVNTAEEVGVSVSETGDAQAEKNENV